MRSASRLTRAEQHLQADRTIQDLKKLGEALIAQWKPADPSWPTEEGAVYIRVSTLEQLLVDQGSVEQQVYIAVSEAVSRSQQDRINYRITHFYIEKPMRGKIDRRPELDRLRHRIKKKIHTFTIMKELSRIFRESTLWKEFFKLCIEHSCQVMIRGLPLNPNDPTQVLQLDILAAFAEYESNVNSKRGRESHFSAMVSSGKFNATHSVLGLDQLIVNGIPKVGFYVRNEEELKTVVWIYETFLRTSSYQVTLAEIAKLGIKNKNGHVFKKHSLTTLLTNRKYIGEWYVNEKNKDKNPRRLMPYEMFEIVSLPHGCVIDRVLWDEVQKLAAQIKGSKKRNGPRQRIYPLSGVLKFEDGTPFGGTSGKSGGHFYYKNIPHNIRLPAEELEQLTRQCVSQTLHASPTFKAALNERLARTQTVGDLMDVEVTRIEADLLELKKREETSLRRLDLFANESHEAAETIRARFYEEHSKIQTEMESLKRRAADFKNRRKLLLGEANDVRSLVANAGKVIMLIAKNDPVALRAAYAQLFYSVTVGRQRDDGSWSVKFIFRDDRFDEDTEKTEVSADFVNRTDDGRFEDKMAREEGIEPPTKRLTAACSTAELLPNNAYAERQN